MTPVMVPSYMSPDPVEVLVAVESGVAVAGVVDVEVLLDVVSSAFC